jgi:hypothetical protein
MGAIVFSVIAVVAFIGPAVILLALSGERWPRRLLWAAATFAPVAVVVSAAVVSETVGGPGLGAHGDDFGAILLVAALFGGWAVLFHYMKRQERHAS